MAGCQFSVGGVSVAALVIAGAQVWIPPGVYNEVITRGGTRPDALEAARLIQAGQTHLVDATSMGEELADLQYYHLGQGGREALTLTAHVAEDAVSEYWWATPTERRPCLGSPVSSRIKRPSRGLCATRACTRC